MNMREMFDRCMEKYQKLDNDDDEQRAKSSTEKVTDADDSFAQYVGLELKKHDETTKQVLKLEIQGVLLKATLGLLSAPKTGIDTNVLNTASVAVGHTTVAQQPIGHLHQPSDNYWGPIAGIQNVRNPFMFGHQSQQTQRVANNPFFMPFAPINGQSHLWSSTSSGIHGLTTNIVPSMRGPRSCTALTVGTATGASGESNWNNVQMPVTAVIPPVMQIAEYGTGTRQQGNAEVVQNTNDIMEAAMRCLQE